jgi:hypothetical protein
VSDTDYNPDYGSYNEDQPVTTEKRILGIVGMIIAVIGGAIAILIGSSIIAVFFTAFLPFTAGLPAKPVAIINSIPTYAFIGFDIFIGVMVVTVVVGILKFIFNVF